MADRNSAEIFSGVFAILAKVSSGTPGKPRRKLAKKVWKLTRDYDFSPYQMEADEQLLALGVADKCQYCDEVTYPGDEHMYDCGGPFP